MAIVYKCKMCGGNLSIIDGQKVCTCEYCKTEQTVPVLDTEQRVALYSRAFHYWRNNDFDKAAGIFELILNENPTDAEAYWSLVLCKYGIEYVEDATSHTRIPTLNRTQYTSIYADEDYKAAISYSNEVQRAVYEHEAKKIDSIQRDILRISEKEEPYDIFICYKETDEFGNRTQDSVLAYDLNYLLTQEGYRVFFSRISLEDKLGNEFEPYIFAAINSAKVMIVLGTKEEYFNSPWVKNEWSRYLKLVKSSKGKKILIPAYKDMSPNNLPQEFSHLQSQDMSKLGFLQDLARGIKKIIDNQFEEKASIDAIKKPFVARDKIDISADNFVKRGLLSLEDHNWNAADLFFENALNIDAECAEAYWGKLLVDRKCVNVKELACSYINDIKNEKVQMELVEAIPEDKHHIDEMVKKYELEGFLSEERIREPYECNRNYLSAGKFRQKQREELNLRIENERLIMRVRQFEKNEQESSINYLKTEVMHYMDAIIKEEEEYDEARKNSVINNYLEHLCNVDKIVENLRKEIDDKRENEYKYAVQLMNLADSMDSYENAINILTAMNGYKDCDVLLCKCKKEYELHIEKAKRIRWFIGGISLIFILIILVYGIYTIISKSIDEKAGFKELEKGNYNEAISYFEHAGNDRYKAYSLLLSEGNYVQASRMESFSKEVEYNVYMTLKAIQVDCGDANEMSEYLKTINTLSNEEYRNDLLYMALKSTQFDNGDAYVMREFLDYISKLSNEEYKNDLYEIDQVKTILLMEGEWDDYRVSEIKNAMVGEDDIKYISGVFYFMRTKDRKRYELSMNSDKELCLTWYDGADSNSMIVYRTADAN